MWKQFLEHDVVIIIELYVKGKIPLIPNSALLRCKLNFSSTCSFLQWGPISLLWGRLRMWPFLSGVPLCITVPCPFTNLVILSGTCAHLSVFLPKCMLHCPRLFPGNSDFLRYSKNQPRWQEICCVIIGNLRHWVPAFCLASFIHSLILITAFQAGTDYSLTVLTPGNTARKPKFSPCWATGLGWCHGKFLGVRQTWVCVIRGT